MRSIAYIRSVSFDTSFIAGGRCSQGSAAKATKHRTLTRFSIFAAAAAAASLLFACANAPSNSQAVAVWDGGRLERDDYEAWIAWQQLAPSSESVRELALIESMADSARARGKADSPEVQLAAEAARQKILLPALRKHLDAQVAITDDDIEALQAVHPDAFVQPRKLFLRGIYKRLSDNEAERNDVRQQMQDLRAQVLDGADLKELAARESESQSRYRQGSIGFVDPDVLPPAVREGVKDLEVGDTSPLIEHGNGLAFYACERIRPAVHPEEDEVRHRLRQNLFRQRKAALTRELTEKLETRVEVTASQDRALTVGDYTLPAGWIEALISKRRPERNPEDLNTQQRQQLLREWGLRIAMADHAESLGLARSEPHATALRWRHRQALATNELRHRVDARLHAPSEEELRRLFDQRKHRLRNPPAYRVAAIQFADAEGLRTAATVERARDTVARIHAGQMDFTRAARAFSIHASAKRGGVLGWLTPQQLGSLGVRLVKPVRQLAPGEDTGLLRLQSGLWAVKLLDQREATPMTFEQAREQLGETLRQSQIERLQASVRERHLEELNLRIFEGELRTQ
ncbi:peptidylprolyl isomerase [Wenzhouxiangella sp. EGI_FJ10409]|uniref:peptidylprolyl isomerase n=1 Tax=Wenzhouxiangella sp. EGI_FJ10409 TaxID=3243767 RepID=UPI0035DF2C33